MAIRYYTTDSDNVIYYAATNAQGDVLGLYGGSGTLYVTYEYDSWGNLISMTDNTDIGIGSINPIRYRGYYYDAETGLYYLQSRYYDPQVGRWISAEPNVYYAGFDTGAGLIGYNVYTYCANNPVNFSDFTGEFLLTALVVGIIAGAAIGGTIGGTVAYNSAKSSGLKGSDLFWATAGGFGKGTLIGGVAGGLISATGGTLCTYGISSVAFTATATSTTTILAQATEVTALQAKKSLNEGNNGWQVANDCIDSIFGNGKKIVSSAFTKASSTSFTYAAIDITKHKIVPLRFDDFLRSSRGKVLSYGCAVYALGQTVYSIFCRNPVARANKRGYTLK